jgi:hypothetical protein
MYSRGIKKSPELWFFFACHYYCIEVKKYPPPLQINNYKEFSIIKE